MSSLRFLFIAALAGTAGIGLISSSAALAAPRTTATRKVSAGITAEVLAREIAARRERVSQFQAITEMARKRGLRVWLFGGTAAAYAHYVRWDLEREAGDARYQPDRFDYLFSNIFRSTQDVDLVVDGDAGKAYELQVELGQRFHYFMGQKEQWEVRTLREPIGDKEALLDNPDFLNQHTDSNSTGMVELTEPSRGEGVVRDLRDWEARSEPQFLRDVAEGKLHYYFSGRHETTKRFKEGKNPPLFSVVRYYTKAFQFGLKTRREDEERLARLIRDFDPHAPVDPYVMSWLNRNGPKLIRHAMDLAFGWNVLERTGLRAKLLELPRVAREEEKPLAWWMAKEPLRDASDPLRLRSEKPRGATARELGLEVVTHETSDFLAYESIRRSHQGFPNVWISRSGGEDETAASGDGFYTRIGEAGARGTGLHIRMNVDSEARAGVDFVRLSGDYVLWLTRDKLKIIHESLKLDPTFALEFLLDPKNQSERGMRWVFAERIGKLELTRREVSVAARIIDRAILNRGREVSEALIDHILPWPALQSHPSWVEWVESVARDGRSNDAAAELLALPAALRNPKWESAVSSLLTASRIMPEVFRVFSAHPEIVARPEFKKWVEGQLKGTAHYAKAIVEQVLSSETVFRTREKDWARWVSAMNHWSGELRALLWEHALSKPFAVRHPRWPQWMAHATGYFDAASDEPAAFALALARPEALRYPEHETWVGRLMTASKYPHKFKPSQRALLATPAITRMKDWPTWMHTVAQGFPQGSDREVFQLLHEESVRAHPDWPRWRDAARLRLSQFEGTVRFGPANYRLLQSLYFLPEAVRSKTWAREMREMTDASEGSWLTPGGAAEFTRPHVMAHPKWLEAAEYAVARAYATSGLQLLDQAPVQNSRKILERLVPAFLAALSDDGGANILRSAITIPAVTKLRGWPAWLKRMPKVRELLSDARRMEVQRIDADARLVRWIERRLQPWYRKTKDTCGDVLLVEREWRRR